MLQRRCRRRAREEEGKKKVLSPVNRLGAVVSLKRGGDEVVRGMALDRPSLPKVFLTRLLLILRYLFLASGTM